MGLVNLTTNLKSLRYGKDRIGGGSSNQPYIKRDIPDSFSDVGRTGGPDVILRGGTLTPGRAARDVSRLTQMFFDFKSIGGPLFIAKENILSRTSVATDGKGKALNNGVYLPTSTLLQSAGNSLGLHLNKQGIDPFKGIGKNGGGIFELFGGTDPLGQPTYIEITSNPTHESKLLDFTDNKINNTTDSPELLNYQGGPGSVLGIGKTRIPLAKDRTGKNNPNLNYTTGSFELGSPFTLYDPSIYTSPTDKTDVTLDLQTKLGATPKFVSEYPEIQNDVKERWTPNVFDNVITAKSVTIDETAKVNTAKSLAGVMPIIAVKSENDLTTAVIRFAISTLQTDIQAIANGTATAETVTSYTSDVLAYIAEDQNIDADAIAPDISAIADSPTTSEDTAVQ